MTQKRTLLITGAGSGMGTYMVKTTAKAGHRVYAGIRQSDTRNASACRLLNEFAAQHKLDIRPLELDVESDASVEAAIQHIQSDTGHLDVLVNNAGKFYMGITEGFTLEQARQQMEINFFAPLRLYRAVIPLMRRQQQGLVINTSSVAGRLAFPFMGLYCSSKFALDALAECFRYELSSSHIDSITIEPGPINTGILTRAVREADLSRLPAYGELASVPSAMLENFNDIVRQDPSADPQLIADKVLELINTPYGKRPMRTIVGEGFGSQALNQFSENIQTNVLNVLNMAAMDPNQQTATVAA